LIACGRLVNLLTARDSQRRGVDMKPLASSIDPIRYRPGGSWLVRLGRSNLFAWMVSIGLHVAVFLALYLVAFGDEVQPRRLIIPEARLAGPAGPTPSQALPPLKLSRQPAPTPADRPHVKLDELPIAAVTLDSPPALALPGSEEPDATNSLTSEAMASPLAAAPISTFFGQAGNAYRVVYVLDVSASIMAYASDDIVREMKRSVRQLVPSQRFHIVVAGPLKVGELGPRRLVPAIGTYKAQAMKYLDTVAEIWDAGKADPIEAMRRAFAVRPELIYFLSDGAYFDVQDDLLRTLKQLNPHQEVRITVIGFDPSPAPRALLERIAREHGGHFRVVEPR